MISSPAVITMSLSLLFPYSMPNGCITDMPSLSTFSQSLPKRDLLPIRAFLLHLSKHRCFKRLLQIIKVSLQRIQHLSSGLDLGYQWASEKEVNGGEKTCPHSPCFCHLHWKKSLCSDRTVAFFHLLQYTVCVEYLSGNIRWRFHYGKEEDIYH